MKKLIVLIFNIILACSCFATTAINASAKESQAAFSLEFELTADNGESVVMVDEGDVITVTFSILRSDSSENYKTNGFQNYIHYDLNFFEFVEGSVTCFDDGAAVAKKQNSITFGEIIQCQNMDKTYSAAFVFCTFKLKVIGATGSGMVYNDKVYAFDSNREYVTVETQHLQAIIDIGCTHAHKTKVNAQEPTCTSKGWSAYYDCDDCDAVFDENGFDMIAGIPYEDEVHTFSEELSFDGFGHWYQCTDCNERSKYASHNGGTASCGQLAECKVCGAEYGTLDKENHQGGTYLANYKMTWFWGDGYTGDVCCSGCHEVQEKGEVVSMFNIFAWPLWIIIIFILALPIVVIGWLVILFIL